MTKKVREIVKILNRNGFIKIDQNGSHMKFYNPFTNLCRIIEKTFQLAQKKVFGNKLVLSNNRIFYEE